MQCTQLVQCARLIRKEIQSSLWISVHPNPPIVDAIIDPVRRDLEQACQLRNGQHARDRARMRLTACLQYAMSQTENLDGTAQHVVAHGRPIAASR